MSDKHFVGRDLTGFEDNGKTRPVSRVTLTIDEDNAVTAGDDTGYEIVASCPHATQAMADAILARMKGYQYQMYTAEAANIDPAAELGDGITADGVYGVISRLSDDGGGYPDVTGPGEAELEDEYPVGEGPMTKEFNRKLGGVRSYITKTASQIQAMVEEEITGLSSSITVELQSITSQVNGLDGRVSTVEQTAEGLTSSVNGLDGQFTEFKQTVEGISSTVTGLGGEFSELQQTIEGLTVSGPGGSTLIKGSSIETGSLQLTGLITWGDLDDDVSYTLERSRTNTFTTQPTGPYYVGDLWYKDDGTVWRCKIDEEREGRFYDTDWEQIQDAGLTEAIVHTLITGDLVESPTIRGAEIEGGQMNINNNFVVDSEGNLSIGGNIDLSGGTITWGDNKPESGITEERAAQIANDAANDAVEALASGNWVSPSKTFISEKKLESPEINAGTITGGTISGANIYGGTFKNQGGTYWIELGNTGHDHVLRLYKSGQEDVPLFSVGETDGFVYLNAHGYPYLTTENTGAYTISHPMNEWDFSSAQVTGLTAVFA